MAADDPLPEAVLGHWRGLLGAARLGPPLHDKGTVHTVTAEDGPRYVLKEIVTEIGDVPRAERLVAQARVLRHLQAAGVPVAAPLWTDDDRLFAEQDGRLFTLSPLLPTGSGLPNTSPEHLGPRYGRVGAAIARLHRALATYPRPIPSWTMDLPRRVYGESLPRLARRLAPGLLGPLRALLGPLRGEFAAAFAGLPMQPIHGDCHGGNVLLCDGEVSGFVDLDHLPTGPRLYDLAYYLADRLKWWIEDAAQCAHWLACFDRLLVGYAQEQPLSARERAALWFGLLAVQTFMVEWFAERGDEANLARNLDTFHWLARHRETIARRLS